MDIREFFPPILLKLAKKVKRSKNSTEYESYSKAKQVCAADGYQDTELSNMVADKTVIYKDVLKQKPFTYNPTQMSLLAAINQYLNIYATKSLNILDFGGACGAHYFEIRRSIPNDISLKWFVVETDQMVRSAFDRKLNNDELTFVSSVEEVKEKIDFIHTSCALQYTHSPYEFTETLLNLNANRIFFNRMMFNENDRDFVTVQKSLLSANGPGDLPKGYNDRTMIYPHTTMSFKKFNSMVVNNGYEEEWMLTETTGNYQINNEKIIGRAFLYVKK